MRKKQFSLPGNLRREGSLSTLSRPRHDDSESIYALNIQPRGNQSVIRAAREEQKLSGPDMNSRLYAQKKVIRSSPIKLPPMRFTMCKKEAKLKAWQKP